MTAQGHWRGGVALDGVIDKCATFVIDWPRSWGNLVMDVVEAAAKNLFEGLQRQAKRTHVGVAIFTAAILDHLMELALKRAMRPMSNALSQRLFDESVGPLNSFASKIVMAYALGIVSKEEYAKLEKIRKIRNVFAHSSELLDFGSKKIAPLLAALNRPKSKATQPAVVFAECVKAIADSLTAYIKPMDESPDRTTK
jgi:DNA-binding MltR family transcriptional regulator